MNLDDIALPQITFCNLNPFHGNAYSTMYDMGINQLEEYADLVNNITDCEGCVNDDKELLSMLKWDLLTSRGYFAYVGPETATKLSHKLQTLIAACYIYTSSTKIRCEDSLFTEFIHPDYYSCWSMELPESYNNSLKSVRFIFNLDNFFAPQYDIFPMNHAQGQFLGVLMVIHNAGTLPATDHDGVFLQPGRFFDIHLTGQFRKMLADPYNTCTEDVYIANTSWLYTRVGCISHCIETHVIDNCTCRSMDQFNLFVKEGFPKCCLDITYGKEQLLQNVRCAIEVAHAYTKTCKNKWLHSCFELKYILSLTSAHWPPYIFNDEFYSKFLFNNSYVWYYSDESLFVTEATVFDDIDYIDLVNRNFMRVDVRLQGGIVLYEDFPTTTFETLTSGLGGTLNLFAGISLYNPSWVIFEERKWKFTIPWICYERSFSEFYLSIWNQLVFILLQNVRCAIEVAHAYTKTCKNKWLHSCFELKYILSLTSAHWPPYIFNDEFYSKFLFNNSYVWYYSDESFFVTEATVFDDIDYIDLVNRNFMRVDVRLQGGIVLYEDIPTTTFETLTSGLGGTLNLFAGISLLIAI